jgi:hydrogenase maturation protein HypF
VTTGAPAPLLVLGVGNPSRGDDAVGSLFIERAEVALRSEVLAGQVELLTDFQLQVEHALDLVGRRRVVFVDASFEADPPYRYSRVEPCRDQGVSTHSMSPSAVLDAHRMVVGEPPPSWVLAIRGDRFELGEDLTPAAAAHLDAALTFFVDEARAFLASERAPVCVSEGRRIEVEGTVQGVGFRPWVHRTASALGIRGHVLNTPRGVTIEAHATAAQLDALVLALNERAPAAARVREVRCWEIPASSPDGFAIVESEHEGERLLTVPPDLGTCATCIREVEDPTDRHHRYAFTSCTECGPRFSVVEALPYDRAHTSMAPFPLCPACAFEYGALDDRRFHAQAVACPVCGPRLWLADPSGVRVSVDDPIGAAAERLLAGEIVGVQGLGGFHLACDATNAEVVAELRRRKRRDHKPLAVMVIDEAAAAELAELDDETRRLLGSAARPIVLATAHASSRVLADGVTGPSSRVGIFLPYTPLHRLLLARVARPLVMTSGNLSGEPIAITHEQARRTLGSIVDAFLFHDRPMVRRVEDSVVSSTAGETRVVRRARGYAPDAIRLPVAAPEPVLAVGGHLKNTACLVLGDRAYVTPHLGDLESFEAEEAFVADVEAFERLLGVRAQVLVHDLHPAYASTRYALGRTARVHLGVQHHVAHVLAATAELGLVEPVIGVVFDGSGWGPDGTSWGAEILLVDGTVWSRPSTFRALPLPGGERAIREVWRTAYGALHEAFGEEAKVIAARLPVFGDLVRGSLPAIDRMLMTSVQTVSARGMGRWFDALGALVLGIPRASFEGHVAIAWEEMAASNDRARPYPVSLPRALAQDIVASEENEIDLRPTVRAAIEDLLAGVSASTISARFHQTIVEATAATVLRALASSGARRVVLSGGSLQNRILARGLFEALGPDRVRMAREVPVNDGGLALGQAWAGVLSLQHRGGAPCA